MPSFNETLPLKVAQTHEEWTALAKRHLEAAKLLANNEPSHPEDAVYLAGFALEVALKGKTVAEKVPLSKLHDLTELLYRSQLLRSAREQILLDKLASELQLPSNISYLEFFEYLFGYWNNQMRYSITRLEVEQTKSYLMQTEEAIRWIAEA
jgi:HEPN domain-containing protein